MRGCCGGALMCQVVDSEASVMWSGMHQSESTQMLTLQDAIEVCALNSPTLTSLPCA